MEADGRAYPPSEGAKLTSRQVPRRRQIRKAALARQSKQRGRCQRNRHDVGNWQPNDHGRSYIGTRGRGISSTKALPRRLFATITYGWQSQPRAMQIEESERESCPFVSSVTSSSSFCLSRNSSTAPRREQGLNRGSCRTLTALMKAINNYTCRG